MEALFTKKLPNFFHMESKIKTNRKPKKNKKLSLSKFSYHAHDYERENFMLIVHVLETKWYNKLEE